MAVHRTEPRVVALCRTLVVLMLFAGAVASSSSSPTVLTTSGPVVGQTIDGVDGFLGVPFAAAPARFATAVEHPEWTSPRDATAVGSQCMQHGLGVVPPILGLRDQRLALQWVRDNAPAFGGDRNHVMIYGSSAGGASVAGHLVLPESAGLFHAAAIESPGGHQGWMPGTQRTDDDWMSTKMVVMFSTQLATSLGCGTPSNLTCLRAIDMQTLSAAAGKLRFAPALAREGSYPLGLIRRGEYTRVPTIVGGQSCESCIHAKAALGPYEPTGRPISKASFDAALLKAGFNGTMLSASGQNESGVSPELLEVWYAKRIATEGRWRTFARILSDSGHACSAALHAQALGATSSSVWRYFFEFKKPGSGVPGACHGAQRTWVNAAVRTTTPSQLDLEQSMANWWSSLGARGNPNGPFESVEWTAYVPGVSDDAMFLDAQPGLPAMNASVDTKREECEHWKGYLGW